MRIEAFTIPHDASATADLNARLAATRWPDAVVADWSYGAASEPVERLVRFWSKEYDWADAVARLNLLPHYRAEVDGFGIHFLRFESRGARAIPLLLMNGWPSTFVEY